MQNELEIIQNRISDLQDIISRASSAQDELDDLTLEESKLELELAKEELFEDDEKMDIEVIDPQYDDVFTIKENERIELDQLENERKNPDDYVDADYKDLESSQ